MGILDKLFGDPNKKVLDVLQKRVDEINALEKEYEQKSHEELRSLTQEFQEKLSAMKKRKERDTYLDKILPQAGAIVREGAKRTLQQRHFDVQLMGGLTLHEGNIAEMRTGEGKTLSSTFPIYLNALTGKGVHVVTVNDYLARRDASWMGGIFNYLGLSVACLQQQGSSLKYDETATKDEESEGDDSTQSFKVDMDNLAPCSRNDAYAADITYGTNSEFGFDYLRDNMVQEREKKAQRGLNYAIIDEVDSVLIDEARTPLIISAPDMKSADLYQRFSTLVPALKENEHYNKDEERKAVTLTSEGIKKMEELLHVDNIYTEDVTLAHQLDQALKAAILYEKDKEYVVQEGEVIIVDQFTGRLMEGRRFSQGLHQAIEAKESVEIKQESRTLATITIQNYFRMYRKLAGMTGTAATEAEEFHKIYELDVTSIPTNKPITRLDHQDAIYKNEKGKIKALIETIRAQQEKGQPVLVGTISIEKNEAMGAALTKAGVRHEILNAKNHEREAEIIAQAGKKGSVTVATNMAGRGVDIVLGGNPSTKEEAEEVKKLGGLSVFGSERHEARRIDNQLRGRSGRQGDPGESQFFISMDDDLMRIFGSDRIQGVMEKLGLPEDTPIENKMISNSLEKAQQKVEGHNFDIRKHLVEYDDVINKQRATIYKRRNKILGLIEKNEPVDPFLLESIRNEIAAVVHMHAGESEWNVKEMQETFSTIPLPLEGIEIPKNGNEEDKQKFIDSLVEKSEEGLVKVQDGFDDEFTTNIKKTLLLRTIDSLWVDHLDAIDNLRTGIGLRGYGQQDPLVEYKREAFDMYQALLSEIDKEATNNIFKIFLTYQAQKAQAGEGALRKVAQRTAAQTVAPQGTEVHKETKTLGTGTPNKDAYEGARHEDSGGDDYTPPDRNPETGEKIGRNDPCHCGSGKKFKKCHGT